MSSKVQYNKLVKGMKARGWSKIRARGTTHEVWEFQPTGIRIVLPRKKKTQLVGQPFLRQIRQAEEGWLQSRGRQPAARRNPQTKTHRRNAKTSIRVAEEYLHAARQKAPAHETRRGAMTYAAGTGSPEDVLSNLLASIQFAATAAQEAKHAHWGEGEERALQIGIDAMQELRGVVASKNPADIPGGSMSGCIAIMEARPDVRSPGALCNWLAQRSGEYVGGVRMPTSKKRKLKPEQQKALRKVLRGV